MRAFSDGNVLAHLGLPDMRVPIQYVLMYPNKIENVCYLDTDILINPFAPNIFNFHENQDDLFLGLWK